MEEIKNWGGNHQDGHSVDEKVCGLKRTKFIVHLTFHKNKKKERSIVSVIGYRIRICSTIREGITCRAYVNEICHLRLTIVLLLNCGKYLKKNARGCCKGVEGMKRSSTMESKRGSRSAVRQLREEVRFET
jgi:hypothetical protein